MNPVEKNLYFSSVDDSYNLFLKENSISKCSLAYIFVGKYAEQNVQIMEFIKIENGNLVPKDVLEKNEILSKLI